MQLRHSERVAIGGINALHRNQENTYLSEGQYDESSRPWMISHIIPWMGAFVDKFPIFNCECRYPCLLREFLFRQIGFRRRYSTKTLAKTRSALFRSIDGSGCLLFDF